MIERLRRALLPPAAGLAVGYVCCSIATWWLRAVVPDADAIWNRVAAWRIAGWVFGSAHGIPIVVRTAAGVDAPDAPGSFGRLSEVLGGGSDVVFDFSIMFVPIVLLAIAGIAVALLVRRAAPATTRDVVMFAAVSALIYGVGLCAITALSSYEFVAEGSVAPELGLGAATGRLAIGVGGSVLVALVLGAVWGGAFGLAGGFASLEIRSSIDPDDRVVLRGWMRGLGTVTAILAGAMALGGLVAVVMGRAPSPGLVGLGAYLVSANAVAAAILLAHGASMGVALDAGPFTGWERVDVLNVGTSGATAPRALWLLAIVPVAAGFVAGRFIARRSRYTPTAIALRYGVLWGLTLAVFALLLRVRVLSSFSVGSLDLGGGSAAFDPLVALVLGAGWGIVTSYIGARTVGTDGPRDTAAGGWSCPSCSMPNADEDRFCLSCGAARAAAPAL